MGPEHLLAFNAALLAAMLSPGPAMLYALGATLRSGRRAGMVTGLGLGTVAAGWTAMALLGLDGLFAVFPWAYTTIRILGALYLIYIAWMTWRHARQPVDRLRAQPGAAFWGGVRVNLANPKSVLFAAAVLAVVFPPDLTAGARALIVLNHLVVECIVYAALALLIGSPAVARRYAAAKPHFDRASAAVMGALGLRLLVEK